MAVKLESKHLLLKSSLALGVIIIFDTYLIFALGDPKPDAISF